MWGIFWPILGGEAGNIAIVMSSDPLGGQVEAHADGNLQVWELCVLNVPLWCLVIGFLIFGHPVSEASNLFAKFVFHLPVDGLVGSDSLEQAIADRT
jgi:hypothetical protein